MPTTAQRILSEHRFETFAEAQALEAEARDLSIHTAAPNCYGRTWAFNDGSTLTKTREGYEAGFADPDSDGARLARVRRELRAQGPTLVGAVAAAVAERDVELLRRAQAALEWASNLNAAAQAYEPMHDVLRDIKARLG